MKRFILSLPLPVVLLIVIAICGGCSSSKEQKSLSYDDVRKPGLYYSMLVVCANTEEVQAFESTREKYAYRMVRVRGYSVLTSKRDGKTVFITTPGNLDAVPNQNYGLIQLKGHTSDMQGLIDAVKSHPRFIKEDETVLLLGGCQTTQFKDAAGELGVIPIVTRHIGQSAHNDYLGLQLHAALSRMSVKEALEYISAQAPTTAEQYELPTFN